MALNYDLINQDFAAPAGARRNEDNDLQLGGMIYDPYDQYLQSLNQAGSMGISADDMQRWADTAQKMGMTLDQYLGYAMPAGWTTSTDKYGSTIFNSNDGTVNYGGFPQANWSDGTEGMWALPLAIAGAGAFDMGLFGNAAGSLGGTAAPATGTVPNSYWSMLAESGGAGVPSAAAGTVGTAAGTGATAGLSAADILGLQQMGMDAGLSGSALDAFVASGGAANIGIPSAAGGFGSSLTPSPTSLANYEFPDGTTGAPVGSFDYPAGGGLWDSLLGNKNLLSSLIGSGVQGLSSYLASNAQQDAAQNANNTLWNMFQQNRADLEPWRTAGVGALGRLTDLTTPGKQFDTMQADPGYQFRLEQGQKALDNRLRAGGKFYSGSALKAGTDYNQGFASNEFNNVYNRLAGLAGTGQTAATNVANMGQSTANNVANNQTDMGNARASGYVGIGNAVQGGINSYNQQNMLNQLLPLLTRGY
jgi:hypothetical protein